MARKLPFVPFVKFVANLFSTRLQRNITFLQRYVTRLQ